MSKLKKKMQKKRKSERENMQDIALPLYDAGGNAPVKKKKVPVKLLCMGGIALLLLSVIYLPELLYTEPILDNGLVLKASFSAVKETNEYTRDCPDDDFDGDGLVNYLEQQYGCSPRRIDTDEDGISDYAEIYLTDSNPTVYDDGLMEKQVKAILDKEGKQYSDPYKLEGVILWADDLKSRAFGSVVRTQTGYCFNNFNGWVEFPESGYAYCVSEENYTALKYKQDSNAWRIDGDCEVYLSESPLTFTHKLNFAVWKWDLPDNIFGRVASALLPDHAGLITCRPEAVIEDMETEIRTNRIVTVLYDPEDRTRLGSNHNSLEDLRGVYEQINSGSCVLGSLNSSSIGETMILIYGYTGEGNLLVADPQNGEPAGLLSITPAAQSIIAADGTLQQIRFFDFFGLGFSSASYDRIHFIAASVGE